MQPEHMFSLLMFITLSLVSAAPLLVRVVNHLFVSYF